MQRAAMARRVATRSVPALRPGGGAWAAASPYDHRDDQRDQQHHNEPGPYFVYERYGRRPDSEGQGLRVALRASEIGGSRQLVLAVFGHRDRHRDGAVLAGLQEDGHRGLDALDEPAIPVELADERSLLLYLAGALDLRLYGRREPRLRLVAQFEVEQFSATVKRPVRDQLEVEVRRADVFATESYVDSG